MIGTRSWLKVMKNNQRFRIVTALWLILGISAAFETGWTTMSKPSDASVQVNDWSEANLFSKLESDSAAFADNPLNLKQISLDQLPKPYSFLLTQSLMTPGLERYYQRTGEIKTIQAVSNKKKNTYSRMIIMLMDNNKVRNNVNAARLHQELVIAELAFITMNFNELPEKVISAIRNTSVPFGKILIKNNIQVYDSEREYFTVVCNKQLMKYTRCMLDSRLYGRMHTIRKKENDAWVASVMEILPCFTCKDK
ncbi:hypothetical protein [Legionella nagasakiensis]|uniref:hypothetical protein n=1 Tax=Legionella nagasakiensis TaxID=535290 RepID=UPI0013EF990E|nr:hypothetical protein [Legionella nagasakiensis]